MTPSPDARPATRPLLATLWHDHRAVLAVLAFYFVASAGYFTVLDRWDWWQFRVSYPLFTWLAILGSTVRVCWGRWTGDADVWSARRVVGALLVLLMLCPFQSTFNSLKQTLDDVRGFSWDATLASADWWLHGGRHPWEWLWPLVRSSASIRALDLMYVLWFPLLLAFVLWVAWMPDRQLRQRALAATLLVWIVCGVALAFAFPSAGPCYYGAVIPGADPFLPLMEQLQAHDGRAFLFATTNQRGLWSAAQQDLWLPFGGISAMPSVHVGMAVLMALVAGARGRVAGGFGWLYALVVQVGSVVLGWHYAIDGYLAGVVAALVWLLVGWLDSGKAVDGAGRAGLIGR